MQLNKCIWMVLQAPGLSSDKDFII